ncbi:MAG: DUF5665 domain-containing protein [Planktomarina sp.]
MTEHPDFGRLADEVKRLNDHRFIRVQNSYFRMVIYQLIRGLAFGLGSVLGATFLVSVLAYFLSQFDFIPILGDWAAKIALEISNDPNVTVTTTD